MKTKLIPLSQGKFAIVDAEDFEYLNQWKWYYHTDGRSSYAIRKDNLGIINGKRKWQTFRMHRILANAPSDMQVDHINGDGLDNRKSNLRICTSRQNSFNKKKKNNRTSKYKGVSWKEKNKKWQAAIRNNKTIYLGIFDSEEDAATAYNMAALRYFREFAKLNLISTVAV